MRFDSGDTDALRRLPWVDLKSYLDAQGWRHTETLSDKALVFLPPKEGATSPEILLPIRDDLADYATRMAEVIALLADWEQRPELSIYRDLTASGNDVIRLRAPHAQPDGSIAIDDGVVLYREAENLLLAAACAAVDPRRSYHTRKVIQAIEYLRSVRLGQTERGRSFLPYCRQYSLVSVGSNNWIWARRHSRGR